MTTNNESQVYRIDHYLGKETVLNLLALRFAFRLEFRLQPDEGMDIQILNKVSGLDHKYRLQTTRFRSELYGNF